VRLFRKLSFFPVVLLLAAFVLFSVFISKPLRGSEKHGLVEGTIRADPALRPDAPFFFYVALHSGAPQTPDKVPEFPVQDVQTEDDGVFELSADTDDGPRFYLLARVETAKLERFCKVIPLPELKRLENDDWVDVRTGKRLPPVRITLDKSIPCT
jgi:hypothetical protein